MKRGVWLGASEHERRQTRQTRQTRRTHRREALHTSTQKLTRKMIFDRTLFPLLGLAGALSALIGEQPPPFWRERCVAWKDADKDDCNRCCAAFGKNYLTPKALACALLVLQFARLCLAGCCCRRANLPPRAAGESPGHRLKSVLVDGVKRAALSVPTLLYAPTGRKMVWGGLPMVGAVGFAAATLCLSCEAAVLRPSSTYARRRNRGLLNLCCWAGTSAIALAPRPHRYDTLDVKPSLPVPVMARAMATLTSAGFSLVVAGALSVALMCRARDDGRASVKNLAKED